MEIHRELVSLAHGKQLCYAIFCNSIFNINNKIIDQFTSVDQVQELFNEFQISDAVIDAVVDQISQYRFYIGKNIYLNNLNLLQFFKCINLHGIGIYTYKYNIFYKQTSNLQTPSSQLVNTYLRCFGGGITRGSGNMDFRLLPKEHFEIWLTILGKDYVPGSRTFAAYKKTYTEEYHSAKKLRDEYVDVDCPLAPNYILHDHYQKISIMKENLKLKSELKHVVELKKQITELNEQIKKLKDYIRNAAL